MILKPLVLQIEAFDSRGIHVGHASAEMNGRWRVTVGRTTGYAEDIQQAREQLRKLGLAKKLVESDGKKY